MMEPGTCVVCGRAGKPVPTPVKYVLRHHPRTYHRERMGELANQLEQAGDLTRWTRRSLKSALDSGVETESAGLDALQSLARIEALLHLHATHMRDEYL